MSSIVLTTEESLDVDGRQAIIKTIFYYALRIFNPINISPDETYVGNTENLIQRLETHNSGGSKYTCNDQPWELVMLLGFADKLKATAFEKYLKSG